MTPEADTAVEAPQEVAIESSGKPQMEVKIYAPFRVYYEGVGFSISAVNEVGPFDILPKHRNFLCMLVPCDIVVDTPEGKKIVPIKRALMHVKSDRVAIFVDV